MLAAVSRPRSGDGGDVMNDSGIRPLSESVANPVTQ